MIISPGFNYKVKGWSKDLLAIMKRSITIKNSVREVPLGKLCFYFSIFLKGTNLLFTLKCY